MKNRIFWKRPTKILVRGVPFLFVFVLVACKGIRPPDSLVDDTDIRIENGNKKLDPYLGFNKAYTLAAASAADLTAEGRKRNAHLLTEGMALIQANCSSYFTRLGNDGQHLGFARKETSLAGAVTAAFMGLYDASAKVLSATASAFGFTTASMDNFGDTYLFSPDVKSVQELVMSDLEARRKAGQDFVDGGEKNQSLTYTEVNQFLLEMEGSCQPHGIRRLITQAVNGQRAVLAYPNPKDPNAALVKSIDDFNAAADKVKENAKAALSKMSAASAPATSSSSAVSSNRSQASKLVPQRD